MDSVLALLDDCPTPEHAKAETQSNDDRSAHEKVQSKIHAGAPFHEEKLICHNNTDLYKDARLENTYV